MAQPSSKLRGFIGLARHGIEKHCGDLSSLPRLFEQELSDVLRSKPKAFSCSSWSRGTPLGGQLGTVNLSCHVSNSCAGQRLLISHAAKAIRQVRSISVRSQEGMKKIVAPREFSSGCRFRNLGLQRLGIDIRLQHGILSTPSRITHEGSSMMRSNRGGIRGWSTYHVDKQGVEHFKRRGPASWSEKIATQRSMGTILVLVGGGLVVYVTNQQTVPYTHRKHFMLVSPGLERAIGDRSFDMIMKEYKTRILPANHPQSVRVDKISDQIIEALMLGVGSSDWGKLDHGIHKTIDISEEWDSNPYQRNSERPLLEPYGTHTHTDESLDEAWVDKSRQEGLQSGQQGYTKHLEGMKWKVVVVDDEIVNAICIPGGKIVVFTGLLKKFRSDTEVATVVAHEIGHAVARHSAESLTHNIFIVAIQLVVLSVFYVPGLVNSISELLLRLPFSRRMEIEADHIGLILMAAAGYDPRLAPAFYEKLGKLDNAPEYAQYMSTHPSGKKRGEMLRNTATMEEAMTLYQQKMSGQGTEGFF